MQGNKSQAALLSSLSEAERAEFLNSLSEEDAEALLYDWKFWARPDQLPPEGDWFCWLILSGRGWGKTRVGSETVRMWKENYSPIALVGQTKADVRDTMVELGDSSIMKTSPPWDMPSFQPSKRRLVWPNGAVAILYSGDEPDQLRGPQHCFVAGTMIVTPDGEKPIETLEVGDYVITRKGARRVVETHNRIAEVGCISFSNGVELIATKQHRVLQLHGWTSLGNLKQGDTVCTGEKLQMGISQPTKTGKKSISIGGFGKSIMALYQRAFRFTTRIRIKRIITLATSLSSKNQYTFEKMTEQRYRTLLNVWIAVKNLLESGITRAFQFVKVASVNVLRKSEKSKEFAKYAEQPIGQESTQKARETTVASVVSTWEVVGQERVYNITVEGPPEYIANGIIVHNCKAWIDEQAKFKFPKETLDNLELGLRLGDRPQIISTTTPRAIPVIKNVASDPTTIVLRVSTYANIDNLAPSFIQRVIKKYEGTRLGRQELEGEILDDNPNAMWKRSDIERTRVTSHPQLVRIVVAVDPQISIDSEEATTTGIIVAGKGRDGHYYILEDVSLRGTPHQWGTAAVTAYNKNKADRVVGEVNNGGDMVGHTIKSVDSRVAFKKVSASRGKQLRAEPISSLYEQGLVHHVGTFPELEDQCTEWEPGQKSPDRLDALVWCLTELSAGRQAYTGVSLAGALSLSRTSPNRL